jgi:hypothetical protein
VERILTEQLQNMIWGADAVIAHLDPSEANILAGCIAKAQPVLDAALEAERQQDADMDAMAREYLEEVRVMEGLEERPDPAEAA